MVAMIVVFTGHGAVLWKKFKGDPGYVNMNLPNFDD